MESKFEVLRKQLNELGYYQTLHPECVPLIEKLLADLAVTTESLQKYMKISQEALEERDKLEFGAEPYKCDNAKLIRECNDLHLAFIHFKEQHEKIQRDLKASVASLELKLQESTAENNKLHTTIVELQKKLEKSLKKGSKVQSSTKDLNKASSAKNFEVSSAMAVAEEKIAELSKDVSALKQQNIELVQTTNYLESQLKLRNDEIERLNNMLEGGRPLQAMYKDCCYKNVDNKISCLLEEVNTIKRDKRSLQAQLKEALAKQHEAMRRALHLAERNKQLEKEMKDIDRIALAVEAECNTTVQSNVEKISRLQDRMNETLILIQTLERENAKLKQNVLELTADCDAIKLEKKHLQIQLDRETDDKKRLTEKINNFTIIEHDLNMEIDRLMRLTAEQKRKIVELESQIELQEIEEKLPPRSSLSKTVKIPQRKVSKKDSQAFKTKNNSSQEFKTKTSSEFKTTASEFLEKGSEHIVNMPESSERKCCCEMGSCIKNFKELLDKEMDFRQSNYTDFGQKLEEKDRMINQLQKELRTLTSEKVALISRTSLPPPDRLDENGICLNPICKRRERELAILKEDLKHSELEVNTLKSKLQTLNEGTVFQEERIKKAFQDMEAHIRKLEDERRELVKNEVTARSSISHLEDEYKRVKDQLNECQKELNLHKANYNQLKNLHEQTDRALSESQHKLLRSETELAAFQDRIRSSSRDNIEYDKEIARLKADIQTMKMQLTKIDREKDELLDAVDTKTEKIASLEEELREKTKMISTLEAELNELRRKLSKYVDNAANLERIVNTKEQELSMIKQELERERNLREAAIVENKRHQDELSAVASDSKSARKELELKERQIEDLKRQLQHYVAEVRRAEDLITAKELDRNELLDQFRSLSQEANILENTNHTLENEATQSRVQLNVALEHASELERKIENQESLIRSYERQIAELTGQVASLEIQLKQNNLETDHYNKELTQMRDLCVKLDKEKDNVRQELRHKDDRRTQVEDKIDQLMQERAQLQKALEKERNNLDGLEKLLNDARQELIEQRLLNQDLQAQVENLKRKIQELQEKVSKDFRKDFVCQSKSPDRKGIRPKSVQISEKGLQIGSPSKKQHFSVRDSQNTGKSSPGTSTASNHSTSKETQEIWRRKDCLLKVTALSKDF